MILDIILIAILILSAVFGYRKGFVFTLINDVGWIAAVAIAYLLTPSTTDLLEKHSPWYDKVYDLVASRFSGSLNAIDEAMDYFPQAIQPTITDYSNNIVDGIAKSFTDIFFTVLVFAGIFVLVKILLWILLHLLSKDYRDGAVNKVDGVFGFLFGLFRGVIIIAVLLALLLPAANLLSQGAVDWVTHQIDHSFITEPLYENNILLIILQ